MLIERPGRPHCFFSVVACHQGKTKRMICKTLSLCLTKYRKNVTDGQTGAFKHYYHVYNTVCMWCGCCCCCCKEIKTHFCFAEVSRICTRSILLLVDKITGTNVRTQGDLCYNCFCQTTGQQGNSTAHLLFGKKCQLKSTYLFKGMS